MANRKKKIGRKERVSEKHVKKFACFIEANDWEGEEWHFYIPLKDNGPALALLKEKLEAFVEFGDAKGWEQPYSFGDEIPEFEIDILVKHDRSSYMAGHQKLRGELVLSEIEKLPIVVDEKTHNTFFDAFYKGKIENFVVEPE